MTILVGGLPLGLVKGGISYSLTLIFSLLHDLGVFLLDLDPDLDLSGGERKPDLELVGCIFSYIDLFL